MQVQTFQPSPVLMNVVQRYTIVETAGMADTLVVPHFGFVLAIQYCGQVSVSGSMSGKAEEKLMIPGMVLSGIRNSSRKFCYDAGTGTILVQFREAGAYAIFRQSLPDFFEHFEPVAHLFAGADIRRWYEQIGNATSHQERIGIIEQWLTARLLHNDADKLVTEAVRQIHLNAGIISVGGLAQAYDLSIDTFEKRFRKVVGATPKQFANIARMKSLIADKGNNRSLTELAHKYEYYDQSHFIRQFRGFTGQSPREFFKTPYSW
ncbi:helix-turn-helix transcriptional regulator [Chitinophaga sp. Cy-1792]|uniref:helix-turn-helix transcriptional regulator n=1 Tax=Chitinophaga sp. Cy-1792 TaxID=2608339 RepID=UPI001423C6B5|nr:helix-turn-helix transcriptional regulator [Chitinophaga sp. Cy-1792]NIG56787.1 AraC family transcriptional regulator [Chitinophaga sp. Cy-1792]